MVNSKAQAVRQFTHTNTPWLKTAAHIHNSHKSRMVHMPRQRTARKPMKRCAASEKVLLINPIPLQLHHHDVLRTAARKNKCLPLRPGKLVERNYAIIYYRQSDRSSNIFLPAQHCQRLQHRPSVAGVIFTQIAHKSLSHSRGRIH